MIRPDSSFFIVQARPHKKKIDPQGKDNENRRNATTKHGKTGKNNEKRQRNSEKTSKRVLKHALTKKNNKFLDCSGTPPVTRPVGRLAGRPAGRPAETMKTAKNTERKTTRFNRYAPVTTKKPTATRTATTKTSKTAKMVEQ